MSPAEVKARYEHLDIHGVTGGVWLPKDGQGDPANIPLALARGARQNGARTVEGVRVTGPARAATRAGRGTDEGLRRRRGL